MIKGCKDCNVELDLAQQKGVDGLLEGIWPTKCFKCGKELVEL